MITMGFIKIVFFSVSLRINTNFFIGNKYKFFENKSSINIIYVFSISTLYFLNLLLTLCSRLGFTNSDYIFVLCLFLSHLCFRFGFSIFFFLLLFIDVFSQIIEDWEKNKSGKKGREIEGESRSFLFFNVLNWKMAIALGILN